MLFVTNTQASLSLNTKDGAVVVVRSLSRV